MVSREKPGGQGQRRPWLPAEAVFFLVAWPACAVVFRSRAFVDPGSLWHVRVGDLILRDGLMRTDPFTFPFAGKTWIPQQWGGEVLMALAHAVGGFDTILLGFSVLIAALFAWVSRRLTAGGLGRPLAAAVAGFALVAAGFHFYARPHLATIAVTAVVMAVLVDFDRGRLSRKHLLWLVPLHVVWTNIHGGMLGGLLMLGLAAAGWVGLFVGKKPSPVGSWRAGGWLVVLWLAVAGTMFVNPIGLELQRTWFRIVGSPAMAKYVPEHTPLDPAREGDRAVVAFAILFAAVIFTTPPRTWRVTWLLPVVWFVLTHKGIRQGPLFVVTAAVVLADAWPHSLWHRLLSKSGDSLTRDPAVPLPAVGLRGLMIPTAAVVVAVVLQAAGVAVPVVGRGWAKLDSPVMPMEMVEPLRQLADRSPPGTPLYNNINFGGFVIYFAPEFKVFGDDRFELCGDAWLENYVDTISYHPERFDEWQRRYGFTAALVATGEPLEEYLVRSGRWEKLAAGPTAALYELRPRGGLP